MLAAALSSAGLPPRPGDTTPLVSPTPSPQRPVKHFTVGGHTYTRLDHQSTNDLLEDGEVIEFDEELYDDEDADDALSEIHDACDPLPPSSRPDTPPLPVPSLSFADALKDVIQSPARNAFPSTPADTSLALSISGLPLPRGWRSPSPAESLVSYTSTASGTSDVFCSAPSDANLSRASTYPSIPSERTERGAYEQHTRSRSSSCSSGMTTRAATPTPGQPLLARMSVNGWPLPSSGDSSAASSIVPESQASTPPTSYAPSTPRKLHPEAEAMDIDKTPVRPTNHYRIDNDGSTPSSRLINRIGELKDPKAHRGRGQSLVYAGDHWRPVRSPLPHKEIDRWRPYSPPRESRGRERMRDNGWPRRDGALPRRPASPPRVLRRGDQPGRSDSDWNTFSSAETYETYSARGLMDGYHDSVGFYSAQMLQRRLSDRHWPDPPRLARERTVLIGPIPDDVVATELASLLIRKVGPVDCVKLADGVAKVVFEYAHAERARKSLHNMVIDGRHRLSVVLLPEIAAEARADPQRRKQTRIRQARKDARA